MNQVPDSAGYEGIGGVLVFYYSAEREMVREDVWLEQDQLIGHPSCKGGLSTGSHVHVVRKYNGEWLPAGGLVQFVPGRWRVETSRRAASPNRR